MGRKESMAQGSLYLTYWYFGHLELGILAVGYFD